VASLGQLHWFFGNVYEAAVDMPQLLADAHPNRAPCLLGSGSLLRPCQARCRHRLPQPCARRAGTATWSQSNRTYSSSSLSPAPSYPDTLVW